MAGSAGAHDTWFERLGTDLRVSTRVPNTWDSRFVTLSFEVVSP